VNSHQSPTLITSCKEQSDATISRLVNLLIFRMSDSRGKRGFWATQACLAVRLDASFTTRYLDNGFDFDFNFNFNFDGGGDGDDDGESTSWLLRMVHLVVGAITRYNIEKQVNLTWQDHWLIKLIDGN